MLKIEIYKRLITKFPIKKTLLLLALVILFAMLIKPIGRNAFNFPLRDEEDNIITGTWVFQGKKLYKDIFFQRMPMPTIISGAIQKLTKPNTTYILIKRHRDFVLFYSFFFILLLTLRFGLSAFMAAIILEFTKFTLLGNLFHAESLLVYPIIYVVGIFYSYNKHKKIPFFDIIALALLLPFILFTREHLIVFDIFIFLIIFIKMTEKRKTQLLITCLTGFLVLLLIQLPFVSFLSYFKNILPVNLFDFIPSEVNYPWYYGLFSIFFLPIKLLFYPNKDFYLIAKVISLLYIFTLAVFIKQKKYGYFTVAFFSLALLNLRPAELGTFSEGRRFLPWFAALVWITILNLQVIASNSRRLIYSKIIPLLLLAGISILVVPYGLKEFRISPDPYNMWYINYSPFFDYGETIRLLSSNGDTMLAIPQQPLIYWQSGLFSSSPYFFTLSYMYQRPHIFQKVKSEFIQNPPDFFYYEEGAQLKELLSTQFDDYTHVYKEGGNSYLYINKNKMGKISDSKWSQVSRFGFYKNEPNILQKIIDR